MTAWMNATPPLTMFSMMAHTLEASAWMPFHTLPQS